MNINLKSLSVDELKELKASIENELKKRLFLKEGRVQVHWCGECDVKNIKKIYLAIVTSKYKRFKYTFLPLVKNADHSKHFIKVCFTGFLLPGTILKARSYAFGYKEKQHFYKVLETGELATITEEEAYQILM